MTLWRDYSSHPREERSNSPAPCSSAPDSAAEPFASVLCCTPSLSMDHLIAKAPLDAGQSSAKVHSAPQEAKISTFRVLPFFVRIRQSLYGYVSLVQLIKTYVTQRTI